MRIVRLLTQDLGAARTAAQRKRFPTLDALITCGHEHERAASGPRVAVKKSTAMGKSVVTLESALDDFATKLKRRQLTGSLNLARRTTELMIHAVAAQHVASVEGVIQGVAAVGKRLVEARPLGE